ncbi:3TM-type holin [Gynuella sp.]|uniref:3TM-type holin n=1 Tax=Gynuella sp. TaxID=2969146 RepID=UPI003D121998
MNWFKRLLGGANKASPIQAIGNLFDELFTSDEERQAAEIVLKRLALEPGKLQAQINMVEASSRSLWVAGWRPFIGWVCGISLASYFIPKFIVATVVWVITIQASGWLTIPAYPVDSGRLMELVLGMLGLGALRTVEKGMGKTK